MQDTTKEIATAHPEVEFALVLARTIESVKNDPEQLRGVIYELARQKLQDQLAAETDDERGRLRAALEVAIQGVEDNSRAFEQQQLIAGQASSGPRHREQVSGPVNDRPRRNARREEAVLLGPSGPETFAADPVAEAVPVPAPSATKRLPRRFHPPAQYIGILLLVAIVGLVVQRRADILAGIGSAVALVTPAKPPAAAPVAPSPPVPPPAPVVASPPPAATPGLPTAYGVYAVNAGKLFELEPLIGRVPDPRVAISAAINKPSAMTVPDGRLKFIVYRRDSGSMASDQVEIRVIARVAKATEFDAAGKPIVAPSDATWVIRNISIPYRTAPVKDNPEMYEVQPREADAALAPGRYGLVIKGQAYDFTVDGQITDKRQCLERLVASNGVFYSECQKP